MKTIATFNPHNDNKHCGECNYRHSLPGCINSGCYLFLDNYDTPTPLEKDSNYTGGVSALFWLRCDDCMNADVITIAKLL